MHAASRYQSIYKYVIKIAQYNLPVFDASISYSNDVTSVNSPSSLLWHPCVFRDDNSSLKRSIWNFTSRCNRNRESCQGEQWFNRRLDVDIIRHFPASFSIHFHREWTLCPKNRLRRFFLPQVRASTLERGSSPQFTAHADEIGQRIVSLSENLVW